MKRESAGLVVFRHGKDGIEVLLEHMGGPFWQKRDDGSWSIPKGEIEPGEQPIDVARREFQEELGQNAPEGEYASLGVIKQSGGKVVHAWAVEADVDVSQVRSATFTMEFPPRSGKFGTFPEVDRAEWFDLVTARRKILASQAVLLDRLTERA